MKRLRAAKRQSEMGYDRISDAFYSQLSNEVL
jgi:hypothetical protein